MKIKKFISLMLILSVVASLTLSLYTPASAGFDGKLRFNDDGKFKILVFADCQDDDSPYQKMIDLMSDALDNEKPDVVVFTGDNVVVSSESKFRTGAQKIIQPLIDRGIPYAYTFGNHDDEYGVSKEFMHSVYSSLGYCLTYDAQPSLNGFGNCNIPVYSSSGDEIAFNLWMIDSLTYANGGYDHVREDQIQWYKDTSIALEQQAGHKVNSIMFQHIALPEIYNLLTESSTGTKTYLGKKYSKNLNSNATGYLGEFPCPPAVNGGQFDALVERGDVLGVVTGHDHSNSFHGKYKGIGFLQMPGITFESYGDSNCRGYGVIELDERDTSTYSTHTVTYIDSWNGAAANSTWEKSEYYGGSEDNVYISSINISAAVSASTAKNSLTSGGYTLIDKDLNADSGGNYIYMGYKTTTDPTKALRDIRFYVADAAESRSTATVTVNGQKCTYTRITDIDLNKGAGGHYIYAYTTNDENAGPPIKAISFGSSATPTDYKVATTLGSPYRVADLNADAGGEYIYCYLSTVEPLDVSALKQKKQEAQNILDAGDYYPDSGKVLESAMASVDSLFVDLEDGVTANNQDYIQYLCDQIDLGLTNILFQVKFVNYDGSLIESVYVPYGSSAKCEKIPAKASDEQYHYNFIGWDSDTTSVKNGTVVTALFESEHYHSSEIHATCTEAEVCRFCGEVMAEPTGHGKTELKNQKAVSCTSDGYTGDSCCIDCGQVLSHGETIKSSGHSYGDWVYYIMPTVTQTGKDRATCSVCKTSVYRDSPKATTATVNDEFIYGFTANLSKDSVKSYFNLTYLSVTPTASENGVMGTGSQIAVKQKNVTTNYTVVIFGDVNGDGWYDGQDSMIVSCLANGMLTPEDVTAAEYMAADCNHDGVVDEADTTLLAEAGLILSSVDQSKPEAFEASAVYTEYIELIDQSPEAEDSEKQEAEDQPEDSFDVLGEIFALLKRIIELILSYIPVYLK